MLSVGHLEQSSNSGTTSSLNDLFFSDSNTGYVVGDNATIIKTTNGGDNWSFFNSSATNHLGSVYFPNSNTGYAVGNDGTILKTAMDGLVAYYPFNGNANDESGNGNHGTVNGAILTTDRFNSSDKAYYFDGTGTYIDCGNKSSLQISGDITVCAWTKLQPTAHGQTIVNKYHCSGNKGWLIDTAPDGRVCFSGRPGPGGEMSNSGSSSQSIFDDTWHFLVGQRENSIWKIYIDGKLICQNEGSNGDFANSINLMIGVQSDRPSDPAAFAKGVIDDIRIYNCVLSDSEIQQLYNEGKPDALSSFIHIKASVGSLKDVNNCAGYASNATDDFDSDYDIPEPSAPTDSYVQLYFPHPEWQHPLGNNFTQDIRAQADLSDTVMIWDFKVDTDQEGSTVTLNFESDNIPGEYGIKMIDRDNNNFSQNLKENSTYSYTADGIRNFQLVVGDNTEPEVEITAPNGGEMLSNSTYTITWTASDGSGIESFVLEYTDDNDQNYTTIATVAGDQRSYEWNVPQVCTYLAKVKITATDIMWQAAEDRSDSLFTICNNEQSNSYAAGWNMMSVPLCPDDPQARSVIGDDAASYYYLFDYLPDQGYFIRDSVLNGKGYWLASPAAINVDVQGTPVVETVTFAAVKGWNIIANPLIMAIDTAKIDAQKENQLVSFNRAVHLGWISGALYSYSAGDAGYRLTTTLDRWSGYWFRAYQDGISLIFTPEAFLGSSSQMLLKIASNDSWNITIAARSGSVADLISAFGVDPAATNGFDPAFDDPEPPLPPSGEGVSLYFSHPEWGPDYGTKFNRDIQAPLTTNEMRSWTFEVQRQGAIDLTWNGIEIPDYSFILIDLDATNFIDMNVQNSYSYNTSDKVRHFRIEVKNGLSDTQPPNEVLPKTYALLQNYPNPFNPETCIRYQLPNAAMVVIVIYNHLGQQVRILAQGEKSAGFHTITWDARDDFGHLLSNGLYICKMLVNGAVCDNRKMVLVK